MGHNHNADLMADHKALFVTVLAKITLNMHVYEVLTVSEFLSSYVVLILLGSSQQLVMSHQSMADEILVGECCNQIFYLPDFICIHL